MASNPRRWALALLPAAAIAAMAPASGQIPAGRPASYSPGAPAGPTFADLAGLADSAPLVVRANIRKLARVEDERARNLTPGKGRFYVVAQTRALITGRTPLGKSFAYLVDLPLDRKAKPTARKKDEVIVFARPVPGRAGELQLIRPDAQIRWDDAVEARLRTIITALLAPEAPGKVTGVRELIHVPGTLAGEGETQIFLTTQGASAASITVRRQPGQSPQWGASFSELVGEVGRPPARDTLEWYRLACFLPSSPPAGANMSEGAEAQRAAEEDYRMVMASLGPCRRTL